MFECSGTKDFDTELDVLVGCFAYGGGDGFFDAADFDILSFSKILRKPMSDAESLRRPEVENVVSVVFEVVESWYNDKSDCRTGLTKCRDSWRESLYTKALELRVSLRASSPNDDLKC